MATDGTMDQNNDAQQAIRDPRVSIKRVGDAEIGLILVAEGG
ncbi:hypothetical protein [uncultured Boseongicola sp.]|jgi:hypothetical protein|nr:hypothetical protein [uncultured Boseongicola sp.]